jgi:hypothetical protein
MTACRLGSLSVGMLTRFPYVRQEISKAEFKSLKWADVEKIVGKEIMKSRFHGDGDNSVSQGCPH